MSEGFKHTSPESGTSTSSAEDYDEIEEEAGDVDFQFPESATSQTLDAIRWALYAYQHEEEKVEPLIAAFQKLGMGAVFSEEDEGLVVTQGSTEFVFTVEQAVEALEQCLKSYEETPNAPDDTESHDKPRMAKFEDFVISELSADTQQALAYYFNSLWDFRALNKEKQVPEIFRTALKEMGIDIEPGTLQGKYVLRQTREGKTVVVTRIPGAVAYFLMRNINGKLIVPRYMRGRDVNARGSNANPFTGGRFKRTRQRAQREFDDLAREEDKAQSTHVNEEHEAPPDADLHVEEEGEPEQADHADPTQDDGGEFAAEEETSEASHTEEPFTDEHSGPETTQSGESHKDSSEQRESTSEVPPSSGEQQSNEPPRRERGRAQGSSSEKSTGAAPEAPRVFDQRFVSEFGIAEEELRGIEGFGQLSLPQQKLVFGNLKEYAERGADGYLGAVWSGIKTTFGYKSEGVPKKGSKGMDAYGEVLKILIYSAEKYGPKVHEENGELLSDFVGMQFDRGPRNEQKNAVDNLNKAAHAFARVPAEWQNDGNGVHANNEWKITSFLKEKVLKTESRMHFKEFEEKQRAFEMMKQQFATQLEATGVPRSEVIKKLIEIDGQVYNLRTLQTNPEVAETIHNVRDESPWKKAGSMIAQGAIYGGIGAVGRMATAHVLNFMGSPLVAASLAGTRSWNRVAAEQRERDRKARLGVVDGSGTALNIVKASQEVDIGGEKRDVGVIQKLQDSVAEVKELLIQVADAESKYGADAGSIEKAKLAKKLESLKARVSYSYDKLKLDRIQFGDKDTFAMNQTRFFETLAQAQIMIANQEIRPNERTEERLAQYLSYREGAINDRRHNEQFKKVAIAASTAAAFSLAGALAVEEYKTGGVTEKLKEWFGRSSVSFSPTEGLLDAELGNRNTTVTNEYTKDAPSGANLGQGETPSVAAREGLSEAYSIKKGDTLIEIVQSKLPLKTLDGKPLNGGAVLRLLKQLTPAELDKIGVTGGNIDRIYAGKNLNLEELNKALFAHARGGVENIGDFRGAAYELDSDTLNKASVIRETEVTVPDVSDMPNEYPSGDTLPPETSSLPESSSAATSEMIDPITEKKAQILEQYFLKTAVNGEEWGRVQGSSALGLKNGYNNRGGQIGRITETQAFLKKIFVVVEKQPLKITPQPTETIAKFMRRVFVGMAKLESTTGYPKEFRNLFQKDLNKMT